MDDRDRRLLELKRCFVGDAVADARELVRLLEQSPIEDDPTADGNRCRKLAHDLRGAGGSYGYPEVTTLAGRVEDGILAGRTSTELAPVAGQLCSTLERAAAELDGEGAPQDSTGEPAP